MYMEYIVASNTWTFFGLKLMKERETKEILVFESKGNDYCNFCLF